jgi:hypothetical protein
MATDARIYCINGVKDSLLESSEAGTARFTI